MGKKINQQKHQNQSTGTGSIKRERGQYEKRLSPEEKKQVIYLLELGISPIEQVALEFSRNKETIRSIFKNKDKKSLYFHVETYLIKKYLNQYKSHRTNAKEIAKVIKEYIINQDQDLELKKTIEEVNQRRENNKTKRKITFNQNNRRIIKKMVEVLDYYQSSGEAAEFNNTAFYQDGGDDDQDQQETTHPHHLWNLPRRGSSEMIDG